MERPLLKDNVDRLIAQALAEDRAHEDITSQACIAKETYVEAQLVLKGHARIAGLAFLPWILETVDIFTYRIHAEEGKDYTPGTLLATIEGPAHTILKLERSLLNLIQHTSGIATLTAQFVAQVKGFSCAILDTRKTLPGLRAIQKYAVQVGGGKNHRFDLKERVLIKNNHLHLLSRSVHNPIHTAIARARQQAEGILVQIEVEDVTMLEMALDAAPDAILLDNMNPSTVAKAVELNKRKAYLEASGGITLSNARAYAETGVDAISIGALTHSAPAVDISLRM
jgi:nicotinate-nucleotide pyrophosphorylase (carboxylating)